MFDPLLQRGPANALVGWLAVGIIVAGAIATFVTDDFLWASFSLVTAGLIVLPPLLTREWQAMVPWPVSVLAAVAATARALAFYPELSGYVAIAAVGLLVAVELDAFTTVAFSRRFAVVFAMLTTMAVAALWIVVQYYADVLLGTSLLSTQVELQRDIVAVTVVGLLVGVAFHWIFGRFDADGPAVNPTADTSEPTSEGSSGEPDQSAGDSASETERHPRTS